MDPVQQGGQESGNVPADDFAVVIEKGAMNFGAGGDFFKQGIVHNPFGGLCRKGDHNGFPPKSRQVLNEFQRPDDADAARRGKMNGKDQYCFQ